MSPLKKSPTIRRKSDLAGFLTGFAVVVGERIEFWAYDPGVLTVKQRKLLCITAWKKFSVEVKKTSNG